MSKSEMKRKNVMAGKPMMGEPSEQNADDEDAIQVIEKSAYDELQAKLDVARDYMASRRCRCGVTYVCRRCEALEKIKAVTTRVDDKQQNDNTGVEEIKQRLELAKPENCRQIVEDYEYLLQRIEMLEGALKHLKRHFVVKVDRKRLAVVNKALKESD